MNNQAALTLHSNNVGQSPICRKYVIQVWRGESSFLIYTQIFSKLEYGLPIPQAMTHQWLCEYLIWLIKSTTMNMTIFNVLPASRGG